MLKKNDMVTLPQLSVILSAYNSQKTIAKSIESILQQTYKDFELILIDDGSTDTTHSLLQEFANHDNRIKILTNEKNIGLTRSLNKGLQIASGEFIARIDADDICLPDRFEKQIKFFNEHPEVGLLGGHIQYIDIDGKFLKPGPDLPTSDFFIRWRLLFRNSFIHSTIMFRSSYLKDVGSYNEAYKYAQDYEFWSRFIQHTQCANISDIVVQQRISDNAISNKFLEEQNHYAVKIACQNTNSILSGTHVSEDEMVLIRKWFVHGVGKIESQETVNIVKKWIDIFHTFARQYPGITRNENKTFRNWFGSKVLSYNQNVLMIPQLIFFGRLRKFIFQFYIDMKKLARKWLIKN